VRERETFFKKNREISQTVQSEESEIEIETLE